MSIDPAWVAALTAVAGAAAGWFGRGCVSGRAGRPILTLDGGDIVITNPLDEELLLVKIAANTRFALAFSGRAHGEREPRIEHWFRRSRICRHPIAPRSEARLQLLLADGGKPATVRLTFGSGGGTLRRVRVPIRMR